MMFELVDACPACGVVARWEYTFGQAPQETIMFPIDPTAKLSQCVSCGHMVVISPMGLRDLSRDEAKAFEELGLLPGFMERMKQLFGPSY